MWRANVWPPAQRFLASEARLKLRVPSEFSRGSAIVRIAVPPTREPAAELVRRLAVRTRADPLHAKSVMLGERQRRVSAAAQAGRSGVRVWMRGMAVLARSRSQAQARRGAPVRRHRASRISCGGGLTAAHTTNVSPSYASWMLGGRVAFVASCSRSWHMWMK